MTHQRLRIALALDAVVTVLVGLGVVLRPGLLRAVVPDRFPFTLLKGRATARRIGLVVAAFGTAKGLLYAALLGRIEHAEP